MPKHTKGPWTAEGPVVRDGSGIPICYLVPEYGSRLYEARCADAHLMAKAPELLAELEAILTLLYALKEFPSAVIAANRINSLIQQAYGGEE